MPCYPSKHTRSWDIFPDSPFSPGPPLDPEVGVGGLQRSLKTSFPLTALPAINYGRYTRQLAISQQSGVFFANFWLPSCLWRAGAWAQTSYPERLKETSCVQIRSTKSLENRRDTYGNRDTSTGCMEHEMNKTSDFGWIYVTNSYHEIHRK